jgi:predicted PurR-regulated permease PerM
MKGPSVSDPHDTPDLFTANRRWGLAAAIAAALLLAYPLRFALIPFVVAGALAYVATPGVEWLSRTLGWRRWIAATAVFLLSLSALAGLGWWMKAVVFPDAVELTQSLPEMLRKVFISAAGSDRTRLFGHDITVDAVLAEVGKDVHGMIGGEGGIAEALIGGLGAILMFVLTLSTFCYFLVSGPKLALGVLWLFPAWLRPPVARIAETMKPFLFRYIIGMIVVISSTCVLSWIGLGPVMHMPHALVLALMVGLLEFMPVIGAVASALLLGLAAVSQGTIGVVIGVALFTLALRLLIDQVIAPLIYGKASSLHPAAVLFAFLVGGTLYGGLGLLLAVPIAATIKVIMKNRDDVPPDQPTRSISETRVPAEASESEGNGSAPSTGSGKLPIA